MARNNPKKRASGAFFVASPWNPGDAEPGRKPPKRPPSAAFTPAPKQQAPLPASRRLACGLLLVYEDRDLLAVDKPPGLLSIAGGAEREKTAYWILAEYLRKKGEKRRPAAVHRLDRDTSGIMLFAKSAEIKRTLMENWDALVKTRRYTALVEGPMEGTGGTIDAPLGEDRGGRMVVQPGGQRALTRWRLIRQGRDHALISLELQTGRRNQIRAHLAHLGCPVAGDRKYGARTNPLGRLGLHAGELSLYHPRHGGLLKFNSPLPAAFRNSCTGTGGSSAGRSSQKAPSVQ